eukprot:2486181-Pleurochrysis_carterae.AAC.7
MSDGSVSMQHCRAWQCARRCVCSCARRCAGGCARRCSRRLFSTRGSVRHMLCTGTPLRKMGRNTQRVCRENGGRYSFARFLLLRSGVGYPGTGPLA